MEASKHLKNLTQFLGNLEYLLKFNDKYLGNLDRRRKIYAPGDVVDRSGEVSIEVSAVLEGCAWFVGACKGGGVGSGGFQVGSGVWAKRLLGATCFLSLDFFLVFLVHGEKFSGGFWTFRVALHF